MGGLCDGHLFGGAHGIEETKELLDPRNLERVVDALAHAYQRQIPSAMLAGNVCAYQRPDTGGIDVRDIREIDDQRSGGVGAYRDRGVTLTLRTAGMGRWLLNGL